MSKLAELGLDVGQVKFLLRGAYPSSPTALDQPKDIQRHQLLGAEQRQVQATLDRHLNVLVAMTIRGCKQIEIAPAFGITRIAVMRRLRPFADAIRREHLRRAVSSRRRGDSPASYPPAAPACR